MAKRGSTSKKRSDTSSRWPLDDLVFFVDRSLGRHHVAGALRKAGAQVEVHEDHFDPAAPDQAWLVDVGTRGWVVLMKDKRVRRRPLEFNALLVARVRAFVLTHGNLEGEEMAAVMVRHLARMVKLARNLPPPFIAAVTRSGVKVYKR